MNDKVLKSFQFHIPVELEKGDKEDVDSWKIQGIASTPDEDLQGESVDQTGLDISFLKAGRGLFNFDHQKGPENVIGQIDDAEFIDHDGTKALMVKGYLFKHQDRAKAFYNILKSLRKGTSPRVHLSIEGKILQRDFAQNSKIKKARVEKVALTLDPVNPFTYVDLMKSLSNTEEEIAEAKQEVIEFTLDEVMKIKKALEAGAGGTKAPTQMESGEPMTKESLDRKKKKVTYEEKKKKLTKSVINSIIEKVQKSFPDEDVIELTKLVCEIVKSKIQ